MDGTVYILELDRPLGNSRHSAKYYVGWAKDLDGRLYHHRRGLGSSFTRAAVERGIKFRVVWSHPGTKSLERWIKNRKNTERFLKGIKSGKIAIPEIN